MTVEKEDAKQRTRYWLSLYVFSKPYVVYKFNERPVTRASLLSFFTDNFQTQDTYLQMQEVSAD